VSCLAKNVKSKGSAVKTKRKWDFALKVYLKDNAR